jgi:DtxR family Mn-dependent transcriptional regulator
VTDTAKLTASLEDYVESIFKLVAKQGAARVTDIADDLDVTKSSVTGALRNLSSRGLVNYDPYSIITLTDEGARIGARIARRHAILERFLEEILGLARETAEANACRLEHAVEPRVVDRLVKFIDFIEACPRGGDEFREGFVRFYGGKGGRARCADCIALAAEAAERISTPPCRESCKTETRGSQDGERRAS